MKKDKNKKQSKVQLGKEWMKKFNERVKKKNSKLKKDGSNFDEVFNVNEGYCE